MERLLDVSQLEPCEPLQQTLSAVADLGEGDFLRVLHRRDPLPLYPLLEQAGFGWLTRAGSPGNYEIYIWRHTDLAAEAEVSSLTDGLC
ncbi:MAG: DUF2249 domain-containing protein [Gammaproteobacteria bacterium]|nr:DUF2249 domain-containing protein [Gammaproteobacteria bacterium]